MIEWVRKVWKYIFPMTAKESEQRMGSIETVLKESLERQERVLSEFTKNEEHLSETIRIVSSNTDRQFSEIFRLMQRIQTQNDKERGEVCSMLREGVEKQRLEIQTALQESLTVKQKQTDELRSLGQQMEEIIHGDIFRRIEFLQSRLVVMEGLLQSNLLESKEQCSSAVYQHIQQIRSLFPLKGVGSTKGFVRVGRAHDGGYVMFDDFEDRKIAYSFGIADDVSWDMGIAERGLDVYMYDHTIEGLPSVHPRFHFSRIGLAAEGESAVYLKSLPELLRGNGHSNQYGMILKMDIEGAEWDVLGSLDEDTLNHFSQIVVEFHALIIPTNAEKIQAAMERLNRTHQLIHVHANNYGTYLQLGGAVLPELIEGTYLLREEYTFVDRPNDDSWQLDSANNPYVPDVFLGAWDIEQ